MGQKMKCCGGRPGWWLLDSHDVEGQKKCEHTDKHAFCTGRRYFLCLEWICETDRNKEPTIAIWGKLTNLVAWQTFSPLAHNTGNGQISCFFHHLELTIFSSVNICHLRGSELLQRLFRLTLVRDPT
jgi:hypothetical protein